MSQQKCLVTPRLVLHKKWTRVYLKQFFIIRF